MDLTTTLIITVSLLVLFSGLLGWCLLTLNRDFVKLTTELAKHTTELEDHYKILTDVVTAHNQTVTSISEMYRFYGMETSVLNTTIREQH